MEYEAHVHPFAPVSDKNCKVLILGSFPSVKSRENAFYYGHPQNRFWKVLSAVWAEDVPRSAAEKTAFLLRHHIALWDVIRSCDIVGSGDGSIKNAVTNDINSVLKNTRVSYILLNGKAAGRLYEKHCGDIALPYAILPSTSPANAAWSLEKLISAWEAHLKGEC